MYDGWHLPLTQSWNSEAHSSRDQACRVMSPRFLIRNLRNQRETQARIFGCRPRSDHKGNRVLALHFSMTFVLLDLGESSEVLLPIPH